VDAATQTGLGRRPLVIGHRGASGRLPENTLAAFRGAVADGADGVELDVRLSADGRAVVVHDATLTRTAGVAGRVSDLTADELERFDVPTLASVLELTARPRAVVYVEIKGGGPDLEAAVANEVRAHDCHDRVVVLSFNHASLRRLHVVDERIATAASVAPTIRAPRPSAARLAEIAARAEAGALATHVSLATRRNVAALAERGLATLAWTVNRPLVARRLARAGVEAVMTDFPARVAAALDGTRR
jgi:glycerophosphoryl diester phosphodiesterase